MGSSAASTWPAEAYKRFPFQRDRTGQPRWAAIL